MQHPPDRALRRRRLVGRLHLRGDLGFPEHHAVQPRCDAEEMRHRVHAFTGVKVAFEAVRAEAVEVRQQVLHQARRPAPRARRHRPRPGCTWRGSRLPRRLRPRASPRGLPAAARVETPAPRAFPPARCDGSGRRPESFWARSCLGRGHRGRGERRRSPGVSVGHAERGQRHQETYNREDRRAVRAHLAGQPHVHHRRIDQPAGKSCDDLGIAIPRPAEQCGVRSAQMAPAASPTVKSGNPNETATRPIWSSLASDGSRAHSASGRLPRRNHCWIRRVTPAPVATANPA